VLGVIAKSSSQFLKYGVQAAIEIDVYSFGPKLLAELVSGDDFARPLEQKNKDAERLVMNPNAYTVAQQGVTGNIRFESTEPEDSSY
jgi:hypothetical protein